MSAPSQANQLRLLAAQIGAAQSPPGLRQRRPSLFRRGLAAFCRDIIHEFVSQTVAGLVEDEEGNDFRRMIYRAIEEEVREVVRRQLSASVGRRS